MILSFKTVSGLVFGSAQQKMAANNIAFKMADHCNTAYISLFGNSGQWTKMSPCHQSVQIWFLVSHSFDQCCYRLINAKRGEFNHETLTKQSSDGESGVAVLHVTDSRDGREDVWGSITKR